MERHRHKHSCIGGQVKNYDDNLGLQEHSGGEAPALMRFGRFGLATPAHPPAPTAGSKCRRRFLAASLRIDSLNSLDANFRREADRRSTFRLAARHGSDAESSTYDAGRKT